MPTDRLTTVIELQGLAASISGLNNLAMAATQVSIAFTEMQSGAGGITALATGFMALVQAGQLIMSTFRGIVQSIGAAMDAGDKLNQSLARTLILYQNAGRAATPGGLSGFALQRLGQAGIAPQQTLDLMGQLAERGFSQAGIMGLTRAGQEIEAGTGGRTTAIRAAEMFMRGEFQTQRQRFTTQGMLGMAGGRAQMQMGTRLGLSIRFTGNIERDLEAFVRVVDEKFGGVAEALTASKTFEKTQILLATVTAQLGQTIESLLLPSLEFLNRSLLGTSVALNAVLHGGGQAATTALDIAGGILMGMAPGLGLGLEGLAESRRRSEGLNRIDPDSATNRIVSHLAHIDANIATMAGAMVQIVFGGASSFTRSSFTYGELNRAIGSRR